MKKIITFFISALIIANVAAQAPSKMSYQAVVRNSSNALLNTASVGMQVTILQGSPTGTPVYVESHSATTNENGLMNIEIGNGTVVSGDFSTINWANGPYFIKTETDPTGGTNYTISATSQFMSVPYALYAETSGTPGTPGATGAAGGDSHVYSFEDDNSPTPAAGHLAFDDNNTPISTIHINKTNADGTDISAWLNDISNTTNSVKGKLKIFAKDDASDFVTLNITGVSTSDFVNYDLSISYVTGNYVPYPTYHFTNDENIIITFSASGNEGAQGIQGVQGTQGVQGVQGATGAAGNDGLTTSVNGVQQVSGNVTLAPSDLGLGNVDNTSDANKPVSTATQTALNLKADKASPTFTGTPNAPTATAGTNNAQIATTAFVKDAVDTKTNDYLPLTGGVLTGNLNGTNGTFENDLTANGRSAFGTNNVDSVPRLKLMGYSNDGLDGGGGLEIGDGGAVHLRIYRTGNNNFNISTLGSLSEHLGINANYDPNYTLDINGTLRAKGNTDVEGSISATGDLSGNNASFAGDATMNGKLFVGTNESHNYPSLKLMGYSSDGLDGGGGLELGDGGAVRMRIYRTSTNNFNISTLGSFFEYLGINATYDPQYTLDVNGTLRTKGNVVLEGDLAISGTPTAPTADPGTNTTQLATTAFVTAAMNAPEIKSVVSSDAITFDSTSSGKIITTEWGASPFFPENLPDGFTCTIINYSYYQYTSNTLTSAKFFTALTGGAGESTFNMPPSGTVKVNVVTLDGQKCYFISGDIN